MPGIGSAIVPATGAACKKRGHCPESTPDSQEALDTVYAPLRIRAQSLMEEVRLDLNDYKSVSELPVGPSTANLSQEERRLVEWVQTLKKIDADKAKKEEALLKATGSKVVVEGKTVKELDPHVNRDPTTSLFYAEWTKAWAQARDIFCVDNSGGNYTDLNGATEHCSQ